MFWFALLVGLILPGCVKKWQDVPARHSVSLKSLYKGKKGNTYTIKNSQGSFKVTKQTTYYLDEYGIASYYGDKFHSRKTASGITYNQWDMTSAHPTIPLPAVLKVSRTDTGKCVYVLAIDRGPFVKKGPKRVIDLSRGAAKILGMEKQGIAPVRVQCMVRESKKLREEWIPHKKRGKIPYNLASKYMKKKYSW